MRHLSMLSHAAMACFICAPLDCYVRARQDYRYLQPILRVHLLSYGVQIIRQTKTRACSSWRTRYPSEKRRQTRTDYSPSAQAPFTPHLVTEWQHHFKQTSISCSFLKKFPAVWNVPDIFFSNVFSAALFVEHQKKSKYINYPKYV